MNSQIIILRGFKPTYLPRLYNEIKQRIICKLLHDNGKIKYEGEFKDGKLDGHGINS